MVGALSIVRFRTAVKDPMDIVFMFWSIGAGTVIGAGLYLLGIAGPIVIGAAAIRVELVFHCSINSRSGALGDMQQQEIDLGVQYIHSRREELHLGVF